MKKLMLASAIAAVTLFSGNAFAISAGASKTNQAPSATVKVGCGCYNPCHDLRHTRCHTDCCHGYYSLYTYVVPCYGGCDCGGCGNGGYTWRCGSFFGGIFGW